MKTMDLEKGGGLACIAILERLGAGPCCVCSQVPVE